MTLSPAPFDRVLTGEGSRIGSGEVGGKAAGLLRAGRALAARFPGGEFGPFRVGIPPWTVLTTSLFMEFVRANGLERVAGDDDAVARAFGRGTFPATVSGDLWALANAQHVPLAVRSSSLLEDALEHPLAGVYLTKMTPNDQPAPEARFARLVEAIRLVWASSAFSAAAAARDAFAIAEPERMAVVLQRVAGSRHGARYYPDVSGVARSVAYYRFAGARPEEGAAQLALGLGKTIVDGGAAWRFVPSRPRVPAPFGSARERLDATQRRFWAVRMGEPPEPDPLRETEYLVEGTLEEAEADGTLPLLASAWDAGRDRFVAGLSAGGARVLDFAPLLVHDALPLAPLLREVLSACEVELGEPVEIEFTVTLPPGGPPLFDLVQLRPMRLAEASLEVPAALAGWTPLVRSERVLGNGAREEAAAVVHLRRGFDMARSREAAAELAAHDRELRAAGRPYVLVVYGRLGTADAALGLPIRWGDVAGARAVVEASLPGRPVEMSEGSHLFHNLAAAGIPYFSLPPGEGFLDWEALEARPAEAGSPLVRRVAFPHPLLVEVDGRTGRGAIFRREDE